MGHLFKLDSPLIRFLSNVADLIALNLLPILVLFINPELFSRCIIFWTLAGCALTAVINAKMLGPFFARFAPTEQPPE